MVNLEFLLPALDFRQGNAILGQVVAQMLGHHGTDLLKHPATVLVKKLVGRERIDVVGATQKTEIGPDMAGKYLPGKLG